MKVKITYQHGEEKYAFFLANVAGRVLRDLGVKIKEECKHPP